MIKNGMPFSRSNVRYICDIKNINLSFNMENEEMIVGCIMVSLLHDKGPCIVGKIFIYKNTLPTFIEVNLDESYINYLFKDPPKMAKSIGDYAVSMLSVNFPDSILNMETSTDVGMIQLPKSQK